MTPAKTTFFTAKQEEFVGKLKYGGLKRLNILTGSVRAGKTWITLVVWAMWVAQMPIDKDYIMVGVTLDTLDNNCLRLLQDLVGENNFRYSARAKVGSLFGRRIRLEGANDTRSERKIRGATFQGAYVDEITRIDYNFWQMLLSRLSEPGAKLIGSTNPDNPSHWLKTEYLDRIDDIDLYADKFTLDENTFLDPEYVKQIKAEYTGVFYKRFIEGEFAVAEGIIYPDYEEALCAPFDGPFSEYILSIDYGTQNAFAALLWGNKGGVWYIIQEYYYSGRDTGKQLTDEEYAVALETHFGKYIKIKQDRGDKLKVIIDPSAASFITTLKKREHKYKVIPADNAVVDGIRETASAMYTEKIKIFDTCKCLIKEMQGYAWKEDAADDTPIKVNDHACITGDTLVLTEYGEKPISEMVGTTGRVWSYNTVTKQAELKPYSLCMRTQRNAPIYHIELEDGRIIRCTGNHPILTETGYKRADEITDNDRIIEVIAFD